MSALELKIYDIFKSRFSESEASLFIEYIESKTERKVEKKAEIFEQIIQKDIANLETRIEKRFTEMSKLVFIVGLAQFLAIIGSVIAIISFVNK